MKRLTAAIALLIIFLSGCSQIHNVLPPHRTNTAIPIPIRTNTLTPTSAPTNTAIPDTATPYPTLDTPQAPTFKVIVHPDGGLYVGDFVSFEVIPQGNLALEESKVALKARGHTINLGDYGSFSPHGIAGRYQATLPWVWNTSIEQPGEVPLTFTIEPQGFTWQETVTLHPNKDIPPPQPKAHWIHEESNCCIFYTISDTESARDIENITQIADAEAESVSTQMGTSFTEPVIINLIPRTLGHGGFASNEVFVSYLDRNYAGSDLRIVVHHEMVHILDAQIGGELRPTIFVEGLAVYLTGGHFKPEPLMQRAAALLDPAQQENGLGWYLPLIPLADHFYQSQHEIGYLEAASLVEYMVQTWGWEAFTSFYRDIHPAEDNKQSTAIDHALRKHFGISFKKLEENFITHLLAMEVSKQNAEDIRLVVAYYDAVRRYEKMLDPSAYFLTAWLPDIRQMRETGIVADYLRHPSSTENIALETLLVSADYFLRNARYSEAEQAIEAVNTTLNAFETDENAPFSHSELADAHYQITLLLRQNGFVPQRIWVKGSQAIAEASTGWADNRTFKFKLLNNKWVPDNEE